jgi:hypothetical protein
MQKRVPKKLFSLVLPPQAASYEWMSAVEELVPHSIFYFHQKVNMRKNIEQIIQV